MSEFFGVGYPVFKLYVFLDHAQDHQRNSATVSSVESLDGFKASGPDIFFMQKANSWESKVRCTVKQYSYPSENLEESETPKSGTHDCFSSTLQGMAAIEEFLEYVISDKSSSAKGKKKKYPVVVDLLGRNSPLVGAAFNNRSSRYESCLVKAVLFDVGENGEALDHEVTEKLRKLVLQECKCRGHTFISEEQLARENERKEILSFFMSIDNSKDVFPRHKLFSHRNVFLKKRFDGKELSRDSTDEDLCEFSLDIDGVRLEEGGFLANEDALEIIRTSGKRDSNLIPLVFPSGASMSASLAMKDYSSSSPSFEMTALYVSGISLIPLWYFFKQNSVCSLFIGACSSSSRQNLVSKSMFDQKKVLYALKARGLKVLKSARNLILPFLEKNILKRQIESKQVCRCSKCHKSELL